MTPLTKEATRAARRKPRDAERSKNFFALGLISWLYSRPDRDDARVDRRALRQEHARAPSPTWPRSRPASTSARPPSCSTTVLDRAGQARQPGEYTNITGNTALWPGASSPPASCANLPVFLGSYPITPASDILHELSKHKNFGVRTFQAEDEIAAVGSALGAAFAGHLGVTTTQRPGLALKGETISLAVSLELPLLIIDIQRGGPSTGLPTKTEAADLLHGDVRPPRRVAAADRGGVQPVALLRRRHRGRPHRPQVPHAGDPAVRRLPRQRLRAVAAARRRRRCPTSRCAFATEHNHINADGTDGVLAVPARPRDAGPPVGDPGHARPDAPHRRHREGRRLAATSATRPTTTSTWCTCGRPRSPASPRTSRCVEVDDDDDAEVLVLGWGSTWGAIARRRSRACASRARRWRGSTSCT